MPARRTIVVATLGTTQTIAWASSYYLPAIIADPASKALGLPQSVFFGAFSGSLLLTALLGPSVGRAIDRQGGRGVLMLSNLVLACGLAALAAAQGVASLFAAWVILGAGMALGLYDSAFAVLARLYGATARGPMTGITLIAGFASTVGWPATALFDQAVGWRGACLIWAAVNLLLALPLNRLILPSSAATQTSAPPQQVPPAPPPRFAAAILAFVFAAAWFVTGAMAAHLPRLLQIAGATPAAAIAAAALVGPAQVAARLVEFSLLRRIHPIVSARIATVLHPIGAAVLLVLGAPAAIAFALLHGAGNGMLTIARGTLPLAVFGSAGYGLRNGLIGAPARATQALSPLLFGLILDRLGVAALLVSAGMSLAALAALLLLRLGPRPVGAPAPRAG